MASAAGTVRAVVLEDDTGPAPPPGGGTSPLPAPCPAGKPAHPCLRRNSAGMLGTVMKPSARAEAMPIRGISPLFSKSR